MRSLPSPRPQVALLVATKTARFEKVLVGKYAQGHRSRVGLLVMRGRGIGYELRVGLGPLATRPPASPRDAARKSGGLGIKSGRLASQVLFSLDTSTPSDRT